MRGWDFAHSHSIPLKGEWQFYPNVFLSHYDNEQAISEASRLIQVPGDWRGAFSPASEHSYGYGTYRLRILVDPAPKQVYGFWIKQIEASSQIEINGQIENPFGIPGERKEAYTPQVMTYTAMYQASGDVTEIELLVRAANYDHPYKGGIIESIRMGSDAAIDTERMYSIGFQMITFVILLLHSLYAIILFCFQPKQKTFLLFFLLLLTTGISVISDDDRLLLIWLPLSYHWALIIKLLSYLLLAYFMLALARSFSNNHSGRRAFQLYGGMLAAYCLFLLAAPLSYVYWTTRYEIFTLFYLIPVIWFAYVVCVMVVKNQRDAVFVLFSAASIASSVIWGVFVSRGLVDTIYYPIDILAAMIGFSTYWFKRYFRSTDENEMLNLQLKQADKMKDQFLANTSHELRTPLHGIMNIAHTILLNEQDKLQEKSYKDMELLVTISRRMSYLLDDLLDVVRLSDKRIVLRQESLRMQAILPSVMDMLSYMTAGKRVVLRKEISPSFPAVWADEKRLVQILFNLLHNALKYTSEGSVTVGAERLNGYAVIRVADTGAGMDEETQQRVFMAYEQGAHGISGEGGIGLGLSICKQLVELHAGELNVRSELGKGTEFSFKLPLSSQRHGPVEQEHEQERASGYQATVRDAHWKLPDFQEHDLQAMWSIGEAASAIAGDNGSKLNILAVDDDMVNLKVLESILHAEQYHIRFVMNADEALQLLAREQWDLMIVDVMLPKMSGYELSRRVRERFSISELPILLLTARNAPADIYAGFQAGANDYVTKPVDALELRYRVWSLTSLKQSINERLRMEAAYLQAQIHPHFLFNTLNSIMALSDIDTVKMRSVGEAFSSYLRVSFDFLNAGELVPLSHELELVDAYLYIEEARFEERLRVVKEIDAELELMLPPLTIQPLVENAVKHGVLGLARGVAVRIRIAREGDDVRIEIADDGVGMEPALASRLMDRPAAGRKGIGLYNTNRRLMQTYGRGLDIQSRPGQGTVIRFSIPLGGGRFPLSDE